MARGKQPKRNRGGGGAAFPEDPEAFMAALIRRMDECPDAESLNDNVIVPFALALEKVALARGYMLNIFGEASNIVITSDEDAETIYHLIEEYLDSRD